MSKKALNCFLSNWGRGGVTSYHFEFSSYFDEGFHSFVQMMGFVASRDLDSYPGFILRYYWIEKPYDIDALLQELVCEGLRELGVIEHDGHYGMGASYYVESCFCHPFSESLSVGLQFVSECCATF